MAKTHRAEKSDHISFIAKKEGYANWKILWDKNPTVSAIRKNPNILFKTVTSIANSGDLLQLPPITPAKDTKPTKTKTDYVVPVTELRLRMRMLNEDFTAMRDARVRLTEGKTVEQTQTDQFGQFAMTIALNAQKATLQVTPAGAAFPPVPGTPTPAPTPGAPTPEDKLLAGEPLLFELRIGGLNPIIETTPDKSISGLQMRLNNLGFDTGTVDGKLTAGSATEKAIKMFEKTFGLPETGKADPATLAKLKQVHDDQNSIVPMVLPKDVKPGPAPPPPGPPAPIVVPPKGTPSPKLRPVVGSDVGNVAPDFPQAAGAFNHFNSLRYQPIYRISLRFIDDMDKFFRLPMTDDNGLNRRLQCLTYFRLPMDHPRITACLAESWTYFRKNEGAAGAPLSDTAPGGGGLSPAKQKLKDLLQTKILDGGTLPERGKFAKIFLPGHYTIIEPTGELRLGGNRYAVESRFIKMNLQLHKIPITAKVEKLFPNGTWKPAPRAWVYFQLVTPEAVPAAQAAPDPRSTFQAPSTQDVKANVDQIRASNAVVANDPQVDNAHQSKGGKRGLPVPGSIFLLGKTEGHHKAHDATRPLGHAEFNPVEDGSGAIPHSVRALTNDEGECGVVFTPSRCGGDRYKIRAFVGPGTLVTNGKEIEKTPPDPKIKHVTETGTMIVWRVLRIAESLLMPVPGSITPAIANELFNYTSPQSAGAPDPLPAPNPNPAAAITAFRNHLWTRLGLRQSTGASENLLGSVNWAAAGFVSKEYSKAWIDFRVDKQVERTITAAEWKGAFDKALADAKAKAAARNRFNLDKLLYFDANTPFFFGMHTPAAYNASLSAAEATAGAGDRRMQDPPNAAEGTAISALIRDHMFVQMLMFFSKEGHLPGLTIIRAPQGECYGYLGLRGGFPSSGIGIHPHGCYEFFGQHFYARNAGWIFPSYALGADSLQSNAVHETGHCFYCLHQPFGGAGGGTPIATRERTVA